MSQGIPVFAGMTKKSIFRLFTCASNNSRVNLTYTEISLSMPTLSQTNLIYLFIFFLLGYGCVGPIERLYPPRAGEHTKIIYLINHNNWHTGIAFKMKDLSPNIWPEIGDFEGFTYLEVGWGDKDYYQDPEPNLWVTLKAVLWPTDSVLHVLGFNSPVEQFFSESEIIELELSDKGFAYLSKFIHNTYARNELEELIELGEGKLNNSLFYLAKGKFHLFNTCNVWTAQAIRSAGFPITPFYSISAGNLVYQVKDY